MRRMGFPFRLVRLSADERLRLRYVVVFMEPTDEGLNYVPIITGHCGHPHATRAEAEACVDGVANDEARQRTLGLQYVIRCGTWGRAHDIAHRGWAPWELAADDR